MNRSRSLELPGWSAWRAGAALTIGIEEEFMLLRPRDWSLAYDSDAVLAGLSRDLRRRTSPETHAAVMEVNTRVHRRVPDAVAELAELRREMSEAVAGHGLRAAVAGMHPSAVWSDTVVSSDQRYRRIAGSMRVLARREPTLATHVHVGVATPREAVRLLNRLRVHLPLLLALSANSPFWQGRATGFASTRTILFDAFPRSGVPRRFRGYADWVAMVDALVRSGAIDDPSLLWWDARLQPRYGTVEVRVMDAQTTLADVAALAALVQSLARLELNRPDAGDDGHPSASELIAENRFLASRDGVDALLIDLASGERVPASALLERTLAACLPHARRLGCERELTGLRRLAANSGAARQRAQAVDADLRPVAAGLARAYARETSDAGERAAWRATRRDARRAVVAADGIPALPHGLGNHALARVLQREVVTGATDGVSAVRFTVGTEITAAMAQKAKQLASDGKVDASDLETLRTAALAGDESVNDDERMFMAALIDARNVARLKQLPFSGAGDAIEFPEATITPAARARMANLDRPRLPSAIADEERKRDRAAKANDGAGALKHAQALDKAATAEVLKLAGTAFAPAATATLAQGTFHGVAPQTILRAMIAAASDSTPGDLAFAGAVFVIASLSGSALAGDLLAGRIKVDQVPRSMMTGGEWAAYQASGNTLKGDTIYLPTEFDPANLGHQGAVVHELKHAEDDKAAAGPALVAAQRDQNELAAYRRQARFLLDTIAPLSGPDRATALSDAGNGWQAIIAYAMALEARADVQQFGPILHAVNAAAPAGAISPRDVSAALTSPPAQLEAFLIRLIRAGYGMTTPAKLKILEDGLAGDSILDWIKRARPAR